MRENTEPRMWLTLSEGDQLVCSGVVYTITGPPLGFGGSACVYPASCGDSRKLAIKECMPSGLALRRHGNLQAEKTEDMAVLQKYRQRLDYEIALSQEIAALTRRAIGVWECIRPESIIADHAVWKNTDGVAFCLLERLDQMGMSFTDMCATLAPQRGSMPIAMTLKMIRQTAKALGRIHAAGYLHCDIQPNNIFFVDYSLDANDVGDACLLDFGCARKLEGDYVDISTQEDIFTTRGYAPPELLSHSGEKIRLSKAADLYSVGTLLLNCTLGENMVRIGNTQLGSVDAGRIGCTGDARDILNGILRQLLAPMPEDRYQTCEQLMADLDYLLEMVEPPSYLLPGLSATDTFIGRNREVHSVVKAVNAGKQPFIFGVGGYGKSELAAQAAGRIKSVKGAYVVRYLGSMRQTILSMFPQRNRFRETEQQSYDTNLAILFREYRGAVLVIDNFWVMDKSLAQLRAEPAFSDLLNLCPGIKLIFTTRYHVNGGMELGAMAESELLELMRFHLEGTQVEESDLRALIRKVQGNTLLLILMAKLLHESVLRISPAMILEALDRGSLHQFDHYTIQAERMGARGRDFDERQLAAHLTELFRLYALGKEQKKILCCATLIPAGGMDLRLFQDALQLEKPVLDLVKMGLLERKGDTVTIHDLIRAAVREDLKPQPAQCMDFLNTLWDSFDDRQFKSEYAQIAACLSKAAEILPPDVSVCDRAAAVNQFLGYYEDALAQYQKKLELLQNGGTVSSVVLAKTFNDMGYIYGKLGRFLLECDSYVTAICLLGGDLHAMDDGIKPFALNWDSILEEEDPQELAKAYLRMTNANLGNCGYVEMAMDILREQGSDASRQLWFEVYLSMASIQTSMEEWEDAQYFIDKAACILKSLPDANPTMQMDLSITVAIFQCSQQDYHQEVDTRRKILDLAKRFYPEKHPDIGMFYYGLARAYWRNGDYDNAMIQMQAAVAMQRRTLRPQHPLLAESLGFLADLYQKLGQQESALAMLHEAAEAGSVPRMAELGLCCLEGRLGCPVDPEKAFYWLRKAADGGLESAAYHTGICLLRGRGCEKNPALAEEYLTRGLKAPYLAGADAVRALAALKLGVDEDAPDYPVDILGAYHLLRQAEHRGLDVADLLDTAAELFIKRYGPKSTSEEDEP